MRVNRNRFRDGTITEEYPADLKEELVSMINQTFLATVDTEMECLPTQRQITFVLVSLGRELLEPAAETITLRELFLLCKEHTEPPKELTVRGWNSQKGFPPAIGENKRDKTYPRKDVLDWVRKTKGINI